MKKIEYYFRILPKHYMTPRRFMNIMQEQVATKDAKDIGGMIGYMLAQALLIGLMDQRSLLVIDLLDSVLSIVMLYALDI